MNDILRRIETGVDPAPPWGAWTTDLRQLEIKSFPIGIRDQVKGYSFVGHFYCERDTVREHPPVGLAKLDAMPFQIRPAEEPVEAYALAFNLGIAQTAAGVEHRDKPVNICVFPEEPPIEPAGFIILTIGIVVSMLRVSYLIPGQ